jgi:hypothetical protein
MITYKLNPLGTSAQQFVDNVATGQWANTETNQEYLAWLEAGNTPEPAEAPAAEPAAEAPAAEPPVAEPPAEAPVDEVTE